MSSNDTVAVHRRASDDMTLSREIVVLDLTEKDTSSGQSSSAQNLQNTEDQAGELADTGAYTTDRISPKSSSIKNEQGYTNDANRNSNSESSTSNKHCISSHSLSIFICSIGLIFILYVWIVACLFARRDSKISHIKQQFY